MAEEVESGVPAPEPKETATGARALIDALGGGRLETSALHAFLDVELQVAVDVGQGQFTIREILDLQRGAIVPLDKLSGEAVDIRVGNELLATGEVIVIQDKLRVRVVDIVYPPDHRPEED